MGFPASSNLSHQATVIRVTTLQCVCPISSMQKSEPINSGTSGYCS